MSAIPKDGVGPFPATSGDNSTPFSDDGGQGRGDEVDRDRLKFESLKESKRRFLDELNAGTRDKTASVKERMAALVAKAEKLANFLLTKHKYSQ